MHVCNSMDAAVREEERRKAKMVDECDEEIKQVEKFHDAFRVLQEVEDKLAKLANGFYQTGNPIMSTTMDDLRAQVHYNSEDMRDSFTYLVV